MAIWKSYTIADILSEIENERFVLPVIHRYQVWDEVKMELLFDTLLKGYPFGGVMVFEEAKGAQPLFDYRPFSVDGSVNMKWHPEILRQHHFFIIDGQQRLQSFYTGLKGHLNGKALYFDLYSDADHEFEFRFAVNAGALPAESPHNREVNATMWYSAQHLFERLASITDDEVIGEIIAAEKITEFSRKAQVIKNIKAFARNIFTAEILGVSKFGINKAVSDTDNKQKLTELFRRLNNGANSNIFELAKPVARNPVWEIDGYLRETLVNYEERNFQHLI